MKILVVIPAYNEEENILQVIDHIRKNFSQADILVINDCSTDSTAEVLRKSGVAYVNLPFNLGIGGAVQTGYKYAEKMGYDIAVQIDADGQHDSIYLQSVIEPIVQKEADIVIGSRFIDNEGFQSTAARRLGIKILSILIRCLSRIKVLDVTSGFRAVNKKFISMYANDYPGDYPEPEAIVMAAAQNALIKEVPVVMKERQGGISSITLYRSIYYMVKVSLACVIRRLSEK